MADFGAAISSLDDERKRREAGAGGLNLPAKPGIAGGPNFNAAIDLLDMGTKQTATGSVIGAGDANPDAAGRAMTVGREIGAPPMAVEMNLPTFEEQVRVQRSNAIINRNPALADWLATDPMHARIAKDDFDKLDVVSKTTKALADGWSMAVQANERGRLGAAAMTGTDVAPSVSRIDRELAQHPVLGGLYGTLQTIGGFGGGLVDNFLRGSIEGATAGGAGGMVAGAAGGLPGAAAGFALGAGGGAIVGLNYDAARVAAGNTFLNLSNLKGQNGEEIGLAAKEGASILVGIGTYALNSIGVKVTGTATGEAVGKLLSDAVVEATTRPTVQRALGNFVTKLGKTGAQGAGLNAAMVGTSIFGEELGKLADGGDFATIFDDPVQRQRAVDQLITAAVDGAMLFPLLHLPMAAGSLVGDTMRAKSAAADTAAFQAVEAGALESRTRERSLTAFEAFMRKQTDGSPMENIGVTGEAVRTLYQSMGVEPGPGDGLLGDIVPDIGRQLEQVTATGGDIIVPTAAYVAHLSGTPISESLRADIRFRPDGMTMKEAAAYEAERGEHLAALATGGMEAIEAGAQAAEPSRLVYEDIRNKLREVGQTADSAEQYARLVAARYEARAAAFEGAKGTALDLYQAEGLQVRRGEASDVGQPASFSGALKAHMDRSGLDTAEKLSDFSETVSERSKSGSGLGRETLVAVMNEMRGAGREQGEVLNSIVRAVPVDVVNNLFGSEGAAKKAFHDEAMLKDAPAFDADLPISSLSDRANAVRLLVSEVARAGAEGSRVSARTAGEAPKADTAPGANDGGSFSQGEKASITLSDGKAIINLFKTADASSFLHETGHLWLEEVARDAFDPDAPDALKADAGTIAKWLGADDLTKLSTEQHEQFARGFEAYLMEGRAPSSALASAFRKFKSWLVRIYKTAAALRVPMNDEIRGVFDRMVASEDEIASWRQTEGLNPVFASAKDAGMTDAEFRTYTRNVEKSRNQADERMLAKTMEAVRKQRTAEWKEQSVAVRADVQEQTYARRDLKAQHYLRTGKMLDEPEAAPAPERVRISKQALEDMYGTDQTPESLPKGVVAAKDGAHPDELADLFGYRSGDEMVRDLMTLEASRKQAEEATGRSMDGTAYTKHLIDAETRRIMLERHGDALNDGSIEAEALAAVHNAAQADVMAAEARAIARKTGATPLRLDDIRAWADGEIANMSTKRGTNVAGFARAEAKSGRDVQRALLKGDYEAAFKAKQQQLINHVLTTKAAEAAEEYTASMSMLRKLGKTPRRETVQQSFMDQIHSVLERLQIPTKAAPEDLAATPGLAKFVADQAAIGQDVFVPEFMLRDNWRADAADMNMGEYFEAVEGIKSIAHLGRQMRAMEIDGDRVRFSDIVAEMRDTIGDKSAAEVGITSRVTEAEQRRVGLLGWKAALRRVEGWAYSMDHGSRSGPFTKYIVRPVFDALDVYRPEKQRRLQQLWDIIAPRQKELNQGKIFVPEINYTFGNKGELLHAIAHTGNESNLAKLLLGRGWGERGKDGGVDRGRWDAGVSRLIDSGVLKKEDFDTVQAIWDLLDEIKGPAQQAHKDIYGVRFNEVTAQAFETPFGEYKGGYMPAITDRFIVEDGQVRADEAALREQQTGAMFPTTGRGFTKSRVENYTKPLELNLSLIPSHIDSVLRFTHLQPTIRDVGRLMLKDSFRKTLRAVDPVAVPEMLVPWLQRTARQTVVTPSVGTAARFMDKALNTVRKRAGLQILAFNVTNTLQQIGGLSPAVLRSSVSEMSSSLYTYLKNPAATADEIASASPFMAQRMDNKTGDLLTAIRDALEDETPLSDFKNWGNRNSYIFQHMAQNIVDITTWKAAYGHEVAKGVPDKDAIFAADAAVRDTQGGFNAEEISRFETGGALARIFSQMYSYFGSQANLIGTEAALIKEMGFKKGARKAAMLYLFALMIPSVIADGIYRGVTGGGDPIDDDGEFGMAGAMASWFFGTQARYLAAMVPVAGPVAVAVMDPSEGDRIGGTPVVSSIKTAVRAPREIVAAASGDAAPSRAIRDSMTALGLLTGLPLGQFGKPLGYAADVMTGDQVPEDAGDIGRGLVTGRQGQ